MVKQIRKQGSLKSKQTDNWLSVTQSLELNYHKRKEENTDKLSCL